MPDYATRRAFRTVAQSSSNLTGGDLVSISLKADWYKHYRQIGWVVEGLGTAKLPTPGMGMAGTQLGMPGAVAPV